MLSAPTPFTFLLFGASGHLAKLKLYPALYVLELKKRLPEHYAVVGFARSEMSDSEFHTLVEESIRTHMPAVTEAALKRFLTHVHYERGQYDSLDDFRALGKRLTTIEKGWGDAVTRIAYYSVPPTVFAEISENLRGGGVSGERGTFRCIVEKPVGNDLSSFEEVRGHLLENFPEEDIYLLDHYLGKEAVRNIYYLRYANPILERLFKNTIIDHVEITALECRGIEGRSGYFEAAGTFRDMFQSHLLQMAALLTMRLYDTSDALRTGRGYALKQFYLPPAADLGENALQGQYRKGVIEGKNVPGYREEEGVECSSRTNTYAAIKLLTRISRWEGIPFYLRSGKRLTKKETRISISFQEPRSVGKGETPNRLDIILQGEAGMKLHLQSKIGGVEPEFRPLILEDPLVCMGDCLPEHALLLLEAIHGKKHWFLTFEEIHTAWRLVDPLTAYLGVATTPLYEYSAGTLGPAEADEWIRRDGRQWFNN